MHRREFLTASAAITLSACASLPEALPPSPDFRVDAMGERTLDDLPEGLLYWRIETFPTLSAAQAAASPTSIAATVSDRHWLVTLGERGVSTVGATHVAEIGPVPYFRARRYTLRLNHAYAPPGAATQVHSHPGSEAFYVLAGQLTQRTNHGRAVVDAGETHNGRMPGMAMQLQSTGAEALDQLVLFLVDAERPFSTPAAF